LTCPEVHVLPSRIFLDKATPVDYAGIIVDRKSARAKENGKCSSGIVMELDYYVFDGEYSEATGVAEVGTEFVHGE